MSPRKIVREVLRKAPGWKLGGHRGSTHFYFIGPGGATVTGACSPKIAEHTINSILRDMRKIENGKR